MARWAVRWDERFIHTHRWAVRWDEGRTHTHTHTHTPTHPASSKFTGGGDDWKKHTQKLEARRYTLTLNMDGSVSGLEHELQVSHSLSLPSPSLPRSTAPREILGAQGEQLALQVTGPHRCPHSHFLSIVSRAGRHLLSSSPHDLTLSCASLHMCHLHAFLAQAGSSSQKALPAPSPLLFTFSSSLLSKPYLPTWFSVAPSPPLCSPPTHHVSKPCLPTKPWLLLWGV